MRWAALRSMPGRLTRIWAPWQLTGERQGKPDTRVEHDSRMMECGREDDVAVRALQNTHDLASIAGRRGRHADSQPPLRLLARRGQEVLAPVVPGRSCAGAADRRLAPRGRARVAPEHLPGARRRLLRRATAGGTHSRVHQTRRTANLHKERDRPRCGWRRRATCWLISAEAWRILARANG